MEEPSTDVTGKIIGCAIEVHKTLGLGLLESAYEHCLMFELSKLGMIVEHQKPLPLLYKGTRLDCGYRLDLLVNRNCRCINKSGARTLFNAPSPTPILLTIDRLSCGFVDKF